MSNYLAIGQIGTIKGIKVQCLPTSTDAPFDTLDGGICEFYNCAFRYALPCKDIPCTLYARKDNTDVYLKKVE